MSEFTNRDRIFKEIDAERDYQENKWGERFDDRNTINDWVTYIMQYASNAAAYNPETDRKKQLIKVAALAVAAIEAYDRNGEFRRRHYDE